MSAKQARQLVKRAKDTGWEYLGLDGHGHHSLLWPESGERTSIANTPSDHRSLRNDEARLVRISGPLAGGKQPRAPRLLQQRKPLPRTSVVRDFEHKPIVSTPKKGFPEGVKKIIRRRSAGLCEICGNTEGIHTHHRRPRLSGGTSLEWVNLAANGLRLCLGCHDLVEGRFPHHSRIASHDPEYGWLITQHTTLTAEEIPVLYRGELVLLRNDGEIA